MEQLLGLLAQQQEGGDGLQNSQDDALVEFNAGICNMDGTTVIPDSRKGKIRIFRDENSVIHFKWCIRPSLRVEEDLLCFPGEAQLLRIPECSTGRCYQLKWQSANRRRFFWLQSLSKDNDDELINLANNILSGGSSDGGVSGGGTAATTTATGSATVESADTVNNNSESKSNNLSLNNDPQLTQLIEELGLQDMSSLDQEMLLSLLSEQQQSASSDHDINDNLITATPAPRPPASTPAAPQRINNNQSVIGTNNELEQAQIRLLGPPLHSVLDPEIIVPLIMENDRYKDDIKELIALLPTDQQTNYSLETTIRSPQFRQAVDSLQNALCTPQVSSIMTQLGIEYRGELGVSAFCNALQEQLASSSLDDSLSKEDEKVPTSTQDSNE